MPGRGHDRIGLLARRLDVLNRLLCYRSIRNKKCCNFKLCMRNQGIDSRQLKTPYIPLYDAIPIFFIVDGRWTLIKCLLVDPQPRRGEEAEGMQDETMADRAEIKHVLQMVRLPLQQNL